MHRSRALPALARDLLHRDHAVARLPALRRRGQGDGARALRRPGAHLPAMRRDRPQRGRLVPARRSSTSPTTRKGVEMTWGDGSPTVGRIFSPRLEDELGPARDPAEELATRHIDVAASLQARLEELVLELAESLAATQRLAATSAWRAASRSTPSRTGASGPRRRSRSSTSSRRRATPARRSAPLSTSGTRRSAGRAASSMRHAYTGPRYDDGAVESALAAAGLDAERLDDDAALPARRRADRGGRRRRLVPGPDGARPAGAREPLDPRRPAARAR